jgi:sugar phosphate isomerase/epimerase
VNLGIFAKTFGGNTPLKVLSSARSAGYEVVQYNMACSRLGSLPLTIDDDTADAVNTASKKTGVSIVAVSATYNMIHPNLSERERGRRGFEAIAASAHRMGTDLLTVCTGTCDPLDPWRYHANNASSKSWLEMCREFDLLLKIANRYDVLIGVEPELANVVNSAERARELIDTLRNRRIRIVFDPANLFEVERPGRQKSLIERAVALLRDRISLAHAKDRLADGRFATAGTGVLDYQHYLTVLQRSEFSGPLITHGLAADEAHKIAVFLKKTLASLDIRT